MSDFETRIAVDDALFGQHVVENIVLRTWKKRLWAAWKVLNGEAGIILLRVDPRKVYEATHNLEGMEI